MVSMVLVNCKILCEFGHSYMYVKFNVEAMKRINKDDNYAPEMCLSCKNIG